MAQQDIPNRAADEEPADRSREHVGAIDTAGGVTNRPLNEEQPEQSEPPPRGHSEADDPVLPGDESALNTKI